MTGRAHQALGQVLRDRAESYWRDAVTLRTDGDLPMAAAYETVAHELRLCADVLAGPILCAHADRNGDGAHWLEPGERCTLDDGEQT